MALLTRNSLKSIITNQKTDHTHNSFRNILFDYILYYKQKSTLCLYGKIKSPLIRLD